MTSPRRPIGRFSAKHFWLRSDVDAELDAELKFHFARTVESLVEQGWRPGDAQIEAERRFGDIASYRRELGRLGRSRVRHRRLRGILDVVRQDLTFAARGLRRAPGFSVLVIFTLALGIGANAAMFGVVDRLFLSPPRHLSQPEDLRLLFLQRMGLEGRSRARFLTYPDYQDLRSLPAVESAAAYDWPHPWTLGTGDAASKVTVQMATASFFPTLGVNPALGRFYSEAEDQPGAALTAVLSDSFWQRAFGRDPAVLGKVLHLDSARYQVIGVAPEGFTGAELRHVDIWLPLEAAGFATGEALDSRTSWWVRGVVRLATGVPLEQADVQLTAAHLAARAAHEEAGGEPYLEIQQPRLFTGPIIAARGPGKTATSRLSLWLAGVSLLVLLIACANVANLLLTRGIRASREQAVRVALGSG
ncbi:MAG: ABC transporter permease, partial [Thermoanaerobaculia bacterium]|nr:ABC transporter permease [Thermoanaerobaculia bacterium]